MIARDVSAIATDIRIRLQCFALGPGGYYRRHDACAPAMKRKTKRWMGRHAYMANLQESKDRAGCILTNVKKFSDHEEVAGFVAT